MAEREGEGFLVRGADGRLYTVRSDDVQQLSEDDFERARELLEEVRRDPDAAERVDQELQKICGCIFNYEVVYAPWFRKGG